MNKQNGPASYAPDRQQAGDGPQAGGIVRDQEKTGRARRPGVAAWVCLAIVWLVWGSTYLAIRVGVETIPPLLLAAARTLVAGLIMFPLALRGRRTATLATG